MDLGGFEQVSKSFDKMDQIKSLTASHFFFLKRRHHIRPDKINGNLKKIVFRTLIVSFYFLDSSYRGE